MTIFQAPPAVSHEILIVSARPPTRQQFNIWVVTGNSIVCSIQVIGLEFRSEMISCRA